MKRISFPDEILLSRGVTVDDLIRAVYPNLHGNIGNGEYLVKRAILCSGNDDVRDINEKILSAFNGESTEYLSADTLDDADDETRRLYPDEFLNSFNTPGLPPHRLVLKRTRLSSHFET